MGDAWRMMWDNSTSVGLPQHRRKDIAMRRDHTLDYELPCPSKSAQRSGAVRLYHSVHTDTSAAQTTHRKLRTTTGRKGGRTERSRAAAPSSLWCQRCRMSPRLPFRIQFDEYLRRQIYMVNSRRAQSRPQTDRAAATHDQRITLARRGVRSTMAWMDTLTCTAAACHGHRIPANATGLVPPNAAGPWPLLARATALCSDGLASFCSPRSLNPPLSIVLCWHGIARSCPRAWHTAGTH